MQVLVGGIIAGVVLWLVPGLHSLLACLVAGTLTAYLFVQTGPRSLVERLGMGLSVALIAWTAGPRAAFGQSLLWHLVGWTAASAALAYYLRPRAE